MIVLDGAEGSAGGQILRTALALSIVTARPFRIDNIRAGRPKPGLMRQHLTAVQAAVAISGATAEGAALGSRSLSFTPGPVRPGDYRFSVGTAGSATLVLQTVLPPLLTAAGPSRLVLEGGTHNPHAPPFEFLARCFVPALARMGTRVQVDLVRPGFYPAGGGRMIAIIEPVAKLASLELIERGAPVASYAEAIIAGLPHDIATRELAAVGKELGWEQDRLLLRGRDGDHGPGNVLLITLAFEQCTEVVSGFGELGVSAERLASQAANRARGFLASTAAVGPYLADQLLLPMALAGRGAFTTVKPSAHTRSNAAVVQRFLDVAIDIAQQGDGAHLVRIEPR